MLGFLAEEGREELNTSSGDGAVGSENLEFRDGEFDFSTLVGDIVQGVRERALENVEDEGRAGDDGVVGDLLASNASVRHFVEVRERERTVQMCW
jgi:hypothetical protein